MKTHYETLGVAADATSENIKKAYRKLASKHHSDRNGGDDEIMSAINVAYEVLSDTERREHYDKTGQNTRPSSIEQRGMNIVVGRALEWAQATQDGEDDMIAYIRNLTNNDRASFQTAMAQGERLKAKLQKILTKVSYKGSMTNAISEALENRIAEIETKIPQIEENIAFADAALAILNDYEYMMQMYPASQPFLMDLSVLHRFAR